MNTVRITIPFYDKPLVLIDHNERPFVAMSPIVEVMGMDWKSQQRKLNARFASTVVIMTTVADDGRKRAMLCLPLQQLPAWLNTVHPEKVAAPIRDNIRRYQRECDEVLWQYWTTGEARRQDTREALVQLAEEKQASGERGSEAGRNLRLRRMEKENLRLRRMEKENLRLRMAALSNQLELVWGTSCP